MKKSQEKVTLIISTLCVCIILLANLLEYLSGDGTFGLVSTVCFIAAGICLVIAWVQYFRKKNS